ncbi:MAG: signal transduction histidine kinase [Sneathiella sp.]|jgi:signal transduction histidine kinase
MVLLVSGVAHAENKEETVVALLTKAVKHFETAGAEQAQKDFAVKDGEYYKGEFYVVTQSMKTNKIMSHPVNPKLNGKSLMKVKDTDGKAFIQEMVEIANKQETGWVSYKWPHPVTKKIASKRSYIVRSGDVLFISGYYE